MRYVDDMKKAAITLEDNFTDIIGKAQRGLSLSDAALATRAGISESELRRVKSGEVLKPAISASAQALQLGPQALVASACNSWSPEPVEVDGLVQFTTPFHDMTVNAYLAWDGQSKQAVLFDTGADARPVLDFLQSEHLKLELILLTHSHFDHISELPVIARSTGARAYSSAKEPVRGTQNFREGHEFSAGGMRITTLETWGHSVGGTSYVIEGLSKPVALVGDALFAGSMGGGMVSYEDALANNRKKILTLPDATVLCPGHGPMTTVGEEKRHNPFFPELNGR